MSDVHGGVVFRGIRFRYLYSVCFVIIVYYSYGMSNYILMVQFNGIYYLCHLFYVYVNGQYKGQKWQYYFDSASTGQHCACSWW